MSFSALACLQRSHRTGVRLLASNPSLSPPPPPDRMPAPLCRRRTDEPESEPPRVRHDRRGRHRGGVRQPRRRAGGAEDARAGPGPGACRGRQKDGPAARRGLQQQQRVQERRPGHRHRQGIPDDHRRGGRARCGDRVRQPVRTRSGRNQRRVRRPAECGRRCAAGLVLHARPEEAGGRRGLPGGRAHAVARREGGHGEHRPSPAGRQGRPGLRAPPRVHDRGRPQYRALAEAVARMEAADRTGALPGSRSSAARPPTRRRSRWRARASSSSTTSGARSTATGWGRTAISAG